MNEPIIFFSVFGLLFLYSLFFNVILWLRYASYVQWAQSFYSYTQEAGLPFSSFFRSYVSWSAHKWLIRIVALLMLLISALPFLLILFAVLQRGLPD